MTLIPDDPRRLGLSYSSWRYGQKETIEWLVESDSYGKLVVAPPGYGKTGMKLAVPLALNQRAISLTHTIALQMQEVQAYHRLNLLMGQPNYTCEESGHVLTVDQGRCHRGFKCGFYRTCEYFQRRDHVNDSLLTSMNYSYWLTERRFVGSMKPPPILMLDECHTIERIMMQHISIVINPRLCQSLFLPRPAATSLDHLIRWANKHVVSVEKMKDALEQWKTQRELSDTEMKRLKDLRTVWSAMDALLSIDSPANWVIESRTPLVEVRPVFIHPFTDLLWHGAGRLILFSATIPNVDYFAKSIGLPATESITLPSIFPAANRPVVLAPMQHHLSRATEGPGTPAWNEMVEQIDSILDRHQGQKGMIHSGSYARAEYIKTHSRHSHRMVQPRSSAALKGTLKHWKTNAPDALLVSPSAWEGVDLPYEQNEVQIVAKVNWVNRGSPQQLARLQADPLYEIAQVSSFWLQVNGRAMRYTNDRGVTYWIDKSIIPFLKKHAGAWIPGWSMESVKGL